MTTTFSTIKALRETLASLRGDNKIALVPTMGNLHDGHLSLVKLAQKYADVVVVSIFVNPTQFAAGEDLDNYPRTLVEDTRQLLEAGVDYIFAPPVAEMYPVMPPPTQVLAGAISQQLCGKSRPTHFDGVGIVVTKLFNIIQPDIAVFGKKDYQQLAIIKQIVRDLSYDIQIIGGDIVRAQDGLALSSRNQYLTEKERQLAPSLNQEVKNLANKLAQCEVQTSQQLQDLVSQSINTLERQGFKIDYFKVLNLDLTEISQFSKDADWLIVVAAWMGKARLLDNMEVQIKY